MRILHSMLRVADLEAALEFYTRALDMRLLRRRDYPDGRFTLAFCSAARNSSACCAINPTRRAFQWWKRNFRIARRVPPGYPS